MTTSEEIRREGWKLIRVENQYDLNNCLLIYDKGQILMLDLIYKEK